MGETFNGYLNEPPERDPRDELCNGRSAYLDEDGYLILQAVAGLYYYRFFNAMFEAESESQSHPLIAQVAVAGNNTSAGGRPILVMSRRISCARMLLTMRCRRLTKGCLITPGSGEAVGCVISFSVVSGELAVSGSPCRAAIEHYYGADKKIN
jgi:hypothetical protein